MYMYVYNTYTNIHVQVHKTCQQILHIHVHVRTLMAAALNSARAAAVALAKLPSWSADAWSPTVGTAALAAATILPAGC